MDTAHSTRWDRWDSAALAATTLAMASTLAIVLGSTPVPGSFEDDGIYVVTAKSLAEGHGYRRLDLPDSPYQTKYPPLYPFVLSIIWRWAPEFPRNIPAMQVLGGIFGIGAGFLAFRLMRRACRLPPWLPLIGSTTAILTPFWAQLTQNTMSEPLYALLSIAALNAAILRSETVPHRYVTGLKSGMFAALACLCRSIGVTVAAAVIIHFVLRRRWREALVAVALPLLAVCAWTLWKDSAMRLNAQHAPAAALRFDLDYSAWTPRDSATAARVAWLNVPSMAWALLQYCFEPRAAWLDRAARGDVQQGDLSFSAAAAMGMAVLVLALLAGLWVTRGRSSAALHLYLMFYTFVVLLWPFRSDRFIVPVLPMIVTLVMTGAWKFLERAGRLFATQDEVAASGVEVPSGEAPTPERLIPATNDDRRDATGLDRLPAQIMMVVGLVLSLRGLMLTHQRERQPGIETTVRWRDAAAEMVQRRTPENAVVAGGHRAYFYLATGRKFVPFLPFDDAIDLYYPADRTFWAGGRRNSPGTYFAHEKSLRSRGLEYYRACTVEYALMCDTHGAEAEIFGRFTAAHPAIFPVIGNAGPYRLWRVVSR